MAKLVFKKDCYKEGTIRNYGKYGKFEKSNDGKWKRIKTGYPSKRITKQFKERKDFLLMKGDEENYIDTFGAFDLKIIIEKRGLKEEFDNWRKKDG